MLVKQDIDGETTHKIEAESDIHASIGRVACTRDRVNILVCNILLFLDNIELNFYNIF
jgi:hypothetical protein